MFLGAARKVFRQLLGGPARLLPQAPQRGEFARAQRGPIEQRPEQPFDAGGPLAVGVADAVHDLEELGVHALVLVARGALRFIGCRGPVLALEPAVAEDVDRLGEVDGGVLGGGDGDDRLAVAEFVGGESVILGAEPQGGALAG